MRRILVGGFGVLLIFIAVNAHGLFHEARFLAPGPGTTANRVAQGNSVGETMMYAYKDQVCVPWWPLACRMQGRLLDMVARDMAPNMVAPEGRQPRAPPRKGGCRVARCCALGWSDAFVSLV